MAFNQAGYLPRAEGGFDRVPRPRKPDKPKMVPVLMRETEIQAAEALALYRRSSRSRTMVEALFQVLELQSVEMAIRRRPGALVLQHQSQRAGHPIRDPVEVLAPYALLLADWAEQQGVEGAEALRTAVKTIREHGSRSAPVRGTTTQSSAQESGGPR